MVDFLERPGELIDAYGQDTERKAFFTDTSICIGCKACEVACKEWNQVPMKGDLEILGSSYDNTGGLGANTWRHVAFIEQGQEQIEKARESGAKLVGLGMPAFGAPETRKPNTTEDLGMPEFGSPGVRIKNKVDNPPNPDTPEFRWLMSSDVCKHCTYAGCLDVCPTGALYRTNSVPWSSRMIFAMGAEPVSRAVLSVSLSAVIPGPSTPSPTVLTLGMP